MESSAPIDAFLDVYIYRERERDRQTDTHTHPCKTNVFDIILESTCLCVHPGFSPETFEGVVAFSESITNVTQSPI